MKKESYFTETANCFPMDYQLINLQASALLYVANVFDILHGKNRYSNYPHFMVVLILARTLIKCIIL